MTKGIVPNSDVLGRAVSVLNMGSVVQPEIQDLSNVAIKILEQPASNEHRFRYRSEGKSVGALPGANSTAEVKTYPMIKVTGYQVNIQLKKNYQTKIISILHDFRDQQLYLFLVLKQTNLTEHIHTI
jgi:hypothetical protein